MPRGNGRYYPTLHPLLTDEDFVRVAAQSLKRRQAGAVREPVWHDEVRALMRVPHGEQARFITSAAKRKMIRAGRRGGKTVGTALIALEGFLAGRRVLYAVPTQEQVVRFWFEVLRALDPALERGEVVKNEHLHILEIPKTETRIRAKTAWNANTLRGDYADLLIMDEYQLMDESAWGEVGAPMLLDKDGDAIFVYTPPSMEQRQRSMARDKRHAAKMFKMAQADTSGRWAAFTFASHANPHLSEDALGAITGDMSVLAFRREILGEDVENVPGALWTQGLLDDTRVMEAEMPELGRVAVALDPSSSSQATADEMGIVAAAKGVDGHGYVLRDASRRGTPEACVKEAIRLYDTLGADILIGEANNGGEWIGTVVRFVAEEMARQGERADGVVRYKMVWASRGKQTRAEPVSALYEQRRVHHVGWFPQLEEEMTTWIPGAASPNRMDACLVAGTQITTQRGLVPIEAVTCADHVWTRRGWQRVLACGMTQANAAVVDVQLSDGRRLCGTGNHPVYVHGKGFIPLDALVWSDRIVSCNDVRRLNLTGSSTRDGLTPHGASGASISAPHVAVARDSITAISGSPSTVRFLLGAISTTVTMIRSTTAWTIWSVLPLSNMRRHIQKWQDAPVRIWTPSDHWQRRGMPRLKAMRGIRTRRMCSGTREWLWRTSVMAAEGLMRLSGLTAIGPITVVGAVPEPWLMPNTAMSSTLPVPSVVQPSGKTSAKVALPPAPVTVVRCSPGGTAAVYNLMVDSQPEYFANGILVHNCVWAFTELLVAARKRAGVW